ncbi:SulP family inorganic anion transporter [Methylomarinum sp. Ch1-1]|uniref:SulP family inorganic anion transporter n=1 Tax=Methylomarinum roseum TaxID=3067653 RepID=A0AAU7NYK6_9GAMM|nr:SulP family inorganic anion transporter [Methylomarinum sp. Ch1-1]MDP4521817.1 SulP family inorganic anion transporter [Methylomarinum sp. Ch1-1]
MIHKHAQYYLKHLKDDFPAGIVVFLVALPLCLGIALASGAPLFSGVITGIIGGLIVTWLSGSQLSVSGPAAGLTVIVLNAIETLGSFQGLLTAVVIAGLVQILLGHFRAGIIGAFFPLSVIKGMLAAIGLILIIKQLPHALGYHVSYEGDESYMQETAQSSFKELLDTFYNISPGAAIISMIGLLIMLIWETRFFNKLTLTKLIPGPLIAVGWGVLYNITALEVDPQWAVTEKHLVHLPETTRVDDFFHQLSFPDFSYLAYAETYKIALTLAIIASLETLLSIEAVDKLDPLKRIAPTNRELKAQGVGNILSGLLGGLPMTAVIVRSSANINAGGKTSISSFIHGICLLLSVLFFSAYLNQIPLACLAAILLHTGYKLARPSLFKDFYNRGRGQFLPFSITVIAILWSDLLIGIGIGLAVGLYYVIKANYQATISMVQDDTHYVLSLHKDVSFLNKALLRKFILHIEPNSSVTIDASNAQFIDHDILETIEDFLTTAKDENIKVEVKNLHGKQHVKRRHHMPEVIKERSDK